MMRGEIIERGERGEGDRGKVRERESEREGEGEREPCKCIYHIQPDEIS